MTGTKSSGAFTGAGILAAMAASLCCIAPVISLIAGSSSVVASFSWLAPARPWLMGLSVAALFFAWYNKLKSAKAGRPDCLCVPVKKSLFLHSKTFLGLVTLFAGLMMVFPLYAKMFYARPNVPLTIVQTVNNRQIAKFTIQGLSCAACEAEINNELSKLQGVLAYTTSYATNSSLVTFDTSKVNLQLIKSAIEKTGYEVKGYGLINSSLKTTMKK